MIGSSAFTKLSKLDNLLRLGPDPMFSGQPYPKEKPAIQPSTQDWRKYQDALIELRSIKKRMSNIELLIRASTNVIDAYTAIVQSIPVKDPRYRFLASGFLNMRRQLEVYKCLREYETGQHNKRLYHLMKHRFEMRGNTELAHLVKGHWLERLHPLNVNREDLEKELVQWLKGLDGKDPMEHIVEFLFDLDSREGDFHRAHWGMDATTVAAYEIRGAAAQLHAYHILEDVLFGPAQPVRYVPKSHDPGTAITSIRRLPLNTTGGGADRGGGDFIEGDPYVLSPDDRLYSVNIKGEEVIHSQFLSGDCVKGAGLWVVKNGKVLLVDNRSGHYKPSWRGLLQTVEYLHPLGVFHPNAAVGSVVLKGEVMFFRVQDFLRLGKANFPYEATRDVLRGYHRVYSGACPVEPEQARFIPSNYLEDWNTGKKDRWDTWLSGVFGRWHNEPLDPTGTNVKRDWSPRAALPSRPMGKPILAAARSMC